MPQPNDTQQMPLGL